jgi:hypothetical protein
MIVLHDSRINMLCSFIEHTPSTLETLSSQNFSETGIAFLNWYTCRSNTNSTFYDLIFRGSLEGATSNRARRMFVCYIVIFFKEMVLIRHIFR